MDGTQDRQKVKQWRGQAVSASWGMEEGRACLVQAQRGGTLGDAVLVPCGSCRDHASSPCSPGAVTVVQSIYPFPFG